MSISFIDRFRKRMHETNSVVSVGLDLTPDHVPPNMRTQGVTPGMWAYGLEVLERAGELAPAVKFQYAHYAETRGIGSYSGLELLSNLIDVAKGKGLLVILDFKRIDIGPTMEKYGAEGFGVYGADACTLGGPYFGPTFWPAWQHWLEAGGMAINMVRTSNPNDEDDDMQMWKLKDGSHVYERVAERIAAWHATVSQQTNGAGAVGAVVGATHPDEAKRCRELLGDGVFTLVPGYGAQGGGADNAVVALLNRHGDVMGAVNSSRAITLRSWYDKGRDEPRQGDPMKLVEGAMRAANDDLNAALDARLG